MTKQWTKKELQHLKELCIADGLREAWDASYCAATKAERLENAKAFCDECAYPESMKVKAAELSPSNVWVHYFLDGNGHYLCDAALIWERAHGKGEKV